MAAFQHRDPLKKIAVLGAGAWGTALALVASRMGHNVTLWTRSKERAHAMRTTGQHTHHFPDVQFPTSLTISSDLETTLSKADLGVMAIPAQTLRSFLTESGTLFTKNIPLVLACKGIEASSGLLMGEVVHALLPHVKCAALGGPNLAHEVAENRMGGAATLAAPSQTLTQDIAQAFHSPSFRIETSTDMIGVQLAGALKNVFAIGCGLIKGHNLGENTLAAFLTQSLREMMHLGTALGAQQETVLGMAGLGDLILTGSSERSRNTRLGILMGQGKSVEQAKASLGLLAEGVPTTHAILDRVRPLNLELPLTSAFASLLKGEATCNETLQAFFRT